MDSNVAARVNSTSALWAAQAAGIFTWDIASNTLYGDSVIAAFFGIDIDRAMAGLPLQDYLANIDPQDKQRVARAIHAAILTGTPYQEEYRLGRPDGSTIWVLEIGHCFRNREGTPSSYAGVIYDITKQKTARTDGLSDHCQAALDVAERVGNTRLINLLQQAMDEAGNEDSKETIRVAVRH